MLLFDLLLEQSMNESRDLVDILCFWTLGPNAPLDISKKTRLVDSR